MGQANYDNMICLSISQSINQSINQSIMPVATFNNRLSYYIACGWLYCAVQNDSDMNLTPLATTPASLTVASPVANVTL
jgi:hypothetical protein